MKVDVYAVYKEIAERDIRERSVVVIDVLRATTTIVNAMVNGALKVIPVAEVDDAITVMAARLDGRESVIAGERNALPLPGFDLGNSPEEFTSEKVRGKSVVITTTNGTSRAAGGAQRGPNPFGRAHQPQGGSPDARGAGGGCLPGLRGDNGALFRRRHLLRGSHYLSA